MRFITIMASLALTLVATVGYAQRYVTTLEKGWKFTRTDDPQQAAPTYDDSEWECVTVPHDWAIAGPFDMSIDTQEVKVIEDGDQKAKLRTGRTGALPFIGTGWYRRTLEALPGGEGYNYRLEFDGAMSHAKVYVNGQLAGERPYGYSSFAVDITPFLVEDGQNVVAVRLENQPQSSRWYPGAGLYRRVRLVATAPIRVAQWGTYVTTPVVKGNTATVKIRTTVENSDKFSDATIITTLLDPQGRSVATAETALSADPQTQVEQQFKLQDIQRWDIESPLLYTAVSEIYADGKCRDRYTTPFGIRTIRFEVNGGFFLNDRHVPLQGVCMHHDLGPLGAAVNDRALERQLEILKEMGCNAIRTSHNPPAPELLDLCDRMGFLVMDESFDEWTIGKNANGYANIFDEWAERDLTDMIHRDRNHPCVILWSIGNEIREQGQPDGAKVAQFLANICRREDPTRLITAGFNNYDKALENGFAEVVDVFGFNYKPFAYDDVHAKYPHLRLIATETASTVSSRGVYHLPVEETNNPFHDDYQCSSYDVEYPRWASMPDTEFAGQDDNPCMAGEFVWTGFDYLGEPTPYNEETPARSSYFGIVDLAGMKKDRFYLYQSRWSDTPVLHLLPHWNWEGHEGETIPVHCYTNYDQVELFLNGKSLGTQTKVASDKHRRYRMIWDNVVYEPGELRAVAYGADGKVAQETVIRTAGAPHHLVLKADREVISADGQDLSFVEVTVVDKDGNPCPLAALSLRFEVNGTASEGATLALCNGDPTSHESFYGKTMKTFSGKCMAVIGKTDHKGMLCLKVKANGLPVATVDIETK